MDTAANLPSFRTIKNMLESGSQAPGQLQMELREIDPIIRPLSAYSDFIRNQVSDCDDFHHSETTKLTEQQTTSKAS
jgi:hypothetical protein